MFALRRIFAPGLLSGAIAGLLVGLFHLIASEPTVQQAINLEEAKSKALGVAAEPALVSRDGQELGLVVGAVLFGLAVGLVFSVVYALLGSRLGPESAWRRSLRLGAIGFATIVLVPFLKYPANPPAVGDPDTIYYRTKLYLAAIGLSIAAAGIAFLLHRWLRGRLPASWAQIASGAAYLILVAAILAGLPSNPDAIEAPAKLIWHFRLLALGGLALFWTALAVSFGTYLEWRERVAGLPPRSIRSRLAVARRAQA
jgi:predicted cobalt transporter CbtA